ncbi:PD40 domain-containing protein [Sulfidibacter corallicola]|uniref:PD40 domain-containing protein n=1 Tax=Sulfidibacter corallicola TaxID=2818388 RepID=A0A8A4TJ38_SULCO|nr:hypothetical protein [Sulfidibacter corallicola]QTD49613.1 PD40 domain-containing protein [Sulfidibacter corallicola]
MRVTVVLMMTCVVWMLPCRAFQTGEPTEPIGPFMGLVGASQPKLLFPDRISTSLGEYNGTFSPDGKAFYYTVSLPSYDAITVTRMLADGRWSQPEIAPFSGKHPDFDPLFAPDGKRLYFSSRRPVHAADKGGKSGIWVMEKQAGGWSEPKHLPFTKHSDFYSSLAENGTIYFNTWDEKRRTDDLFSAKPGPNGFTIENLGDLINSPALDADPFVAPDESYIIFRSYREGGLGSADLYISFKKGNVWQKPINLGAPINSEAKEICPLVTPDGKLFIFASNRFQTSYYDTPVKNLRDVARKFGSVDNGQLNVYYMDTRFIESLKREHGIQ